MQTQPIQMVQMVYSNQGIEEQEAELWAQMQGLDPRSAEYHYDRLQLDREGLELKIRQEHPDLDPMTLEGNNALNQILDQDPRYQHISNEIVDLLNANPSECSSWGIPMGCDQGDFKVFDVTNSQQTAAPQPSPSLQQAGEVVDAAKKEKETEEILIEKILANINGRPPSNSDLSQQISDIFKSDKA